MEPIIVVFYILGFLFTLLVGKWVYDWYHETGKRNRYMEAQVQLLLYIAEKQGVDIEELNQIIDTCKLTRAKKIINP